MKKIVMSLMLRLFIILIILTPLTNYAMESYSTANRTPNAGHGQRINKKQEKTSTAIQRNQQQMHPQLSSSQFLDKNAPRDQLQDFKKSYVIIPHIDFKNNELFDFLLSLKNNDYTQGDYDDLGEFSKNFLEKKIGLKQKLERLNALLEEKPLLFSKLRLFQNVCTNLSKLSDNPIYKMLNKYKDTSFERLYYAFYSISNLAAIEKDKLFIVVFPEAFFNFFQNRNGFGNFIPFFNENWNKLITKFSKKLKNVIFFTNIIYAGMEQEPSNFEKNFEDFIKENNDQKEILSTYTEYKDTMLNVIPIFNETFIFHEGNKLGSYKKRFILDGDIPFMRDSNNHRYLSRDRLIYVPGASNQKLTSNLFSVEICQDHTRIQKKEKSDFLIIQSASNTLEEDLAKRYEGVCIHSDVDDSTSAVYNCKDGKINRIKEHRIKENGGNLTLKIYNLDVDNPKLFNLDEQYR